MPTFKCLDFASTAMNYPVGMLVCRSEHYQKETGSKGKAQIGIITDYRVYSGEDKTPIIWPVVAWEGVGTGPSVTNPALVDVYRTRDKRRAVYIDLDV